MNPEEIQSWARNGWQRAENVRGNPRATAVEKELALALAEVSHALVQLAERGR